MLDNSIWPAKDYSRVPFRLYHDQEVYDLERERIWRGPLWSFLGFDAEIPKVGDFRTSFIGDIPVVYNRGDDGKVYGFVNRCAHRGSTVRREAYGNAADHTCIYHRWCYDKKGGLIGVPFRRGVKGQGGLDPAFDQAKHGLEKIRIESWHGILFATFSDKTEPLEQYLGGPMSNMLARIMSRPVKILGYQRQRIKGNWKLYCENTRDQYHGSLLHQFHMKFGITRVTQKGGAWMDTRHRHSISYTREDTDAQDSAGAIAAYADQKVAESDFQLKDQGILGYKQEFDDGVSLAICSIFPNGTFQQIRNSMAARQVRPRGMDEFELYWTIFGYEGDDDELEMHRLLQTNMIGPAGFISMEDGEAVEIAHRATTLEGEACSIIEMGGGGKIPDEITFKVSDVPLRGFWSYYAEMMGIEPEGGIR